MDISVSPFALSVENKQIVVETAAADQTENLWKDL